MTLRGKVVLAAIASFMAMALVMGLTTSRLLLDAFSRLERDAARLNTTRAIEALDTDLSQMDVAVSDWAMWDDSYEFIKDRNEEYVSGNLTPAALITLRLNAILFLRSSGEIVFATGLDTSTGTSSEIPVSLLAHLKPGSPLLDLPEVTRSCSGVLLLPEGPFLVAARPISNSAQDAPPRGVLVMGRWLDAAVLKRMENLVRRPVSLRPIDDALPKDWQDVRAALESDPSAGAIEASHDTVSAHALVQDIYGKPALLIRVDMPRDIYREGLHGTLKMQGWLAVAGLVYSFIMLRLAQRSVLSRLSALATDVRRIRPGLDAAARLPAAGNDEVSHLAQSINDMLAALERTTSDRARSEQNLRESEERFRLLFNTMISGFAVHEILCDERGRPVDYRFLDVNPAFCAMTGWRAENVRGRRVRELMPNVEDVWIQRYGQVALSGEPVTFTAPSAALGKIFSVTAYAPRPGQFAVNFVDVTEQKRAEEWLHLQSSALAAAANGVVIADRAGRILWVNEAFTRLTGYPAAEAIGQNPRILKSGRHDPDFYKSMWNTLLGGTVWRGEIINRRKDGSLYDEEMSITPLLDASGQITHFIAIKQDITERKRAERSLAEQTTARLRAAEQQRQILDALPANICLLDSGGKILAVNERWRTFRPCTCLPGGISVGADYVEFCDGLTGACERPAHEAARGIRAVLNGARSHYAAEYACNVPAARHYFQMIVTPLHLEGGRGAIIMHIDVSERKTVEAQLLESQKMETIGRLAGGVAHDFNNLLQSIRGFSDLLLMDLPEADPHRRDVVEIHKAAERAGHLTRQLLAFSRRQPLSRKIFDLNTVVESMAKLVQRVLGENIALELRTTPQLDRLQADQGQIEQIILNLVVNARDAMLDGGRLSLATSNVTFTREDREMLRGEPGGRYVCLSVSDTGTGMAPDVVDHIFEPFFSTKGAERGTGLGLSVVHGIVKQHEGFIRVYTTPGAGSTFRVYLPAFSGDPGIAEPEEDPPAAISLDGQGERILLVEDEEGILASSLRTLQARHYVVTAVRNYAEALVAFEHADGQFDLLFTDVVLPDGNGFNLAETLRNRRDDLRVILTSGYTDERSRWPEIERKGFVFLQKPYPARVLLAAMQRIFATPV